MTTPRKISSVLVLVLGVLAPLAAGQAGVAVNDVFDRPNSTNLGPDWNEGAGNGIIENNRLESSDPNASWCSHTTFRNGYRTTVVNMDWATTASGAKIGVALGFTPSTCARRPRLLICD